jgi:hypothetical protein
MSSVEKINNHEQRGKTLKLAISCDPVGGEPPLISHQLCVCAEPVFVNVYGAQESIPMDRFRQPM